MGKKIWITREEKSSYVRFWSKKPSQIIGGHWYNGGDVDVVHAGKAERIFGIKLAGGPRSIICRRLVK